MKSLLLASLMAISVKVQAQTPFLTPPADSATSMIREQFHKQFRRIGVYYILSRAELIQDPGYSDLVHDERQTWEIFESAKSDSVISDSELRRIMNGLQARSDEIYSRSRRFHDFSRRAKVIADDIDRASALGYLTPSEVTTLKSAAKRLEERIAKMSQDLIMTPQERVRLEETTQALRERLESLSSNLEGVAQKEDALLEDLRERQENVAQRTIGCLVRKQISLAQAESPVKRQEHLQSDIVEARKSGNLGPIQYGSLRARLADIAEELNRQCAE